MLEKKKNECRICYYIDDTKNLISPCDCIGTMQFVHKNCLEHFINKTENEYFQKYCYVCNTKYDFIFENFSFIQYVCLFISMLGFVFYFSLIFYIVAQLIVLL